MQTITVSATKARNSFFELLNQVEKGHEILIEKDSKQIAIISPKRKKLDLKGLLKASEAVHGIWKNYNLEDNPLRRKGATDFLGKWDK